MGAVNYSGKQAKFANIKKGEIHVYQGRGQADLVHRAWEGHITNIAIDKDKYKDDEFDVIKVTLDDGEESIQLKFRLDSAYGRAFCSAIPNADLGRMITITPTYDEDKKRAGMFLNHGRDPIKWKFTRDNPNGCPPLEKITFKGKESWDNTEQLAFFKNLLLNVIKPQLVHSAIAGATDPEKPSREWDTHTTDNSDFSDDMPF